MVTMEDHKPHEQLTSTKDAAEPVADLTGDLAMQSIANAAMMQMKPKSKVIGGGDKGRFHNRVARSRKKNKMAKKSRKKNR